MWQPDLWDRASGLPVGWHTLANILTNQGEYVYTNMFHQEVQRIALTLNEGLVSNKPSQCNTMTGSPVTPFF